MQQQQEQQQVHSLLALLRRVAAAGPNVRAVAASAPPLRVTAGRDMATSPQQLTALAAALTGALRSGLGALLADWPATERHLLQPAARPDAQAHRDACCVVGSLCGWLVDCASMQLSADGAPGTSPQQAAGAAALLARLLLSPSGLLPLLEQALAATADSLERRLAECSARQLQRTPPDLLLGLSASLLRLWSDGGAATAMHLRSTQPLVALEVLQATAVPVARLALALLRVQLGASEGGGSSSSSIRAVAERDVIDRGVKACQSLARARVLGLQPDEPRPAAGSSSTSVAAAQQACTHPAVLQAIVLCLAVAPLQLRLSAASEAGAGTARSSERQQALAAVPAHHPALLVALGLPGLEAQLAQQQQLRQQDWAAALSEAGQVLALARAHLDWLSSQRELGGGSSSSSSSEHATIDEQLLAAAGLAVVEAIALATAALAGGRNAAGSTAAVNDVVVPGLACLGATACLLSNAPETTATASGQEPLMLMLQQQLTAGLARLGTEMLLVLVPAVQRACSDVRQQQPELAARWETALGWLLVCLFAASPWHSEFHAAVSPALLSRPLGSIAALEAGLRQCSANPHVDACCGMAPAVSMCGPALSWQLDTWGQPAALAAAAAADATGELGRRLFALLLSCAKAARLTLSAGRDLSLGVLALCDIMWAAMQQGGPQLLAATAAVLQAAERADWDVNQPGWIDAPVAAARAGSGASGSSDGSGGGGGSSDSAGTGSGGGGGGSSAWPRRLLQSPLAPWLVLVVRCLETIGWWCQREREASEQGQPPAALPQAASEYAAQWCHRAVVWLGLGLQQLPPLCQAQPGQAHAAAGAAEQQAALEQLLAQQVALRAALLQACHELAGRDSDSDSSQSGSSGAARPLSPALVAQLQAFAVGVVRELPLPLCCNAPACTSLRCASELQLVGGKACICAGCGIEAARYCSRDCQAQHWKQHRPTCKRLAAAAAAGSTASP